MKRPVIAIDLDGVLADFRAGWQGVDVIGDPIPGAREFVASIAEFADVLIYTARCGEDLNGAKSITLRRNAIRDWLEKHEIPYHEIWTGRGKPTASAYVDDHAVECRPQESELASQRARAYVDALERVFYLCDMTGHNKKLPALIALRERLD